MDERYTAMAQPPENALKPIDFGALKGKSDINPQWRIEALTEQFGLCGIGWRFEVTDKIIQPLADGQILLYMQVNLYIKEGDGWSAAIPGWGGDMMVDKNKNGLVPNDEAFKMCLTDALGNAAKCVGVAANIYRGLYDSKYGKKGAQQPNQAEQSKAAEPNKVQNWRKNGKQTEVYIKNSWRSLISMTAEQLDWVAQQYGVFPDWLRDEAYKLLTTGAA